MSHVPRPPRRIWTKKARAVRKRKPEARSASTRPDPSRRR